MRYLIHKIYIYIFVFIDLVHVMISYQVCDFHANIQPFMCCNKRIPNYMICESNYLYLGPTCMTACMPLI